VSGEHYTKGYPMKDVSGELKTDLDKWIHSAQVGEAC
jgi:hypothetical protein